MWFLFLTTVQAAEVTTSWKTDAPLLLGASVTYFYLGSFQSRVIGTEANPIFIDSWTHPQWNPEYEALSDFLGHPLSGKGFNGPVLTTIGMGLAMGIQSSDMNNGLQHSVIIMESVAINGLITESLKLAVARPRPFTSQEFEQTYPDAYSGDTVQHEIESWDAYKSFPSGHTSSAAATYFSTATLLANSTDNTNLKIASYSSAALLTALTGWARVRYGMHHPSDVIAGGLLGGTIGFGTVQFHLTR
jgi:membrane-associated phospholipid phosphatase